MAKAAPREARLDPRGYLMVPRKYSSWKPADTIEEACEFLMAIASAGGQAWLLGELDGQESVRFLYEGWVSYGVAERHYDTDWLPEQVHEIEAHLAAAFLMFLDRDAAHLSFVRVKRVTTKVEDKAGYLVHAWLTIRAELGNRLLARLSRGIEGAQGGTATHGGVKPMVHIVIAR